MKRGKPIAGVIVKAMKDRLKQMVCKNPATTLSNKTEKRTENFNYFGILEINGEAIAEEEFNGLYGTGTPAIAMAEQCPQSGV